MKVCHFCSSNVDSIYFSYLGKGLTEKGVKQFFVTLNVVETPKWMGDFSSAQYLSLGIPSRTLYPLAVIRLANFLKKNKIDILHTHLFDAAVIGLIAANLAKTKVKIVSRHHLDEVSLLGTRLHVALDKWTNSKSDCVIVPSDATRRFMLEKERQRNTNIRVIPYGFDFNALSATESDRRKVREEFGFGNDFVIGCVGRFFKNKGHSYLLTALKDVIKEFPNVKLFLLGSGDRKYIEDLINELNLKDFVVFAGYRKDVPACMKAMDLLVHPSLSESFGQVIVEAMSVETPVIVTSVGGVPEIVENEETGLVIQPKNSDAIRDSILEMIRDSELRNRLAKAGKKSVYKKYHVENFIDRHWKCYQELLDKK
jgi:Glycosyltransferase